MTWDKVIKGLAVVGGVIGGLAGGWDTMMQVLLICMVIDYATGWMVALMGKSRKTETGHLDSKVGFVGIGKKMLILALVVLGAQIDSILPDGEAICRSIVIWFYIANEGLSIVENLALAGVPFPASVKKVLEQVNDKADKKEVNIDGILTDEGSAELPVEEPSEPSGDVDEGNP